jgi:hypothetical protein
MSWDDETHDVLADIRAARKLIENDLTCTAGEPLHLSRQAGALVLGLEQPKDEDEERLKRDYRGFIEAWFGPQRWFDDEVTE